MEELIIENIHKTHNYKLLKEVYFDILVPAFPDPEDHMTWGKMKKMAKKSFEHPEENEHILVSVSKQTMPDGTEKPISFFVAIYYKKRRTGLISYMGIRNDVKGISASNIQKQVLIEMEKEASKHNQKLRVVLSLVDLPEHANPKYITLPPTQRIMIMEKNGASYIPIDFYYPIFKNTFLSFFKPKINYKKDAALLGYKLYGKLPTESPEALKDFLDDFYRSYGIDPRKNAVVKQMKHEIDFIPHGINIKLSKRYRIKEKEQKIKKEFINCSNISSNKIANNS